MKGWLLDGIGFFFQKTIDFWNTKLGSVSLFLISPLVWLVFQISKGIVFVESYFNTMMEQGTAITGEAVSVNAGTLLGIGNSFFPLDLCFQYCAVLVPLWLVSLSYRAIKSFIPTLS